MNEPEMQRMIDGFDNEAEDRRRIECQLYEEALRRKFEEQAKNATDNRMISNEEDIDEEESSKKGR